MASESKDQATSQGDLPNSAWIWNAPLDLVLLMLAPVLILPLAVASSARVSVEQISLYVIAFAAVGHQLPGFLRVYGDAELFRRYRWRLILAPLFLVAVCSVFAWQDLNSLVVLLLFWGFWHVMTQVSNITAIYDAKVGASSRWTRQLDWLMCLAWFGGGLLWSPGRIELILRECYQAGAPMVPPTGFHVLQWSWLVLTVVVTLLFASNYISQRNKGLPDNPAKLLLMATSFAFWWYCMVVIQDALLGVAMFEVFHAIQYLGLVFATGRRRAAAESPCGPIIRALYRFPVGLIVVLALSAGFGYAIGWLPTSVTSPTWVTVLTVAFTTSSFLHFYVDGFSWNVREPSNRVALGLDARRDEDATAPAAGSDAVHLIKWSLFIVPAVFLGITEHRNENKELALDQYRNLALVIPNSSDALAEYAGALRRESQVLEQAGDGVAAQQMVNEAIELYKIIVETDEDYYQAHIELGVLYRNQQRYEMATNEFEAALEIKPDSSIAHEEIGKLQYFLAMSGYNAAVSNRNLGRLQRVSKDFELARSHFERAVELAPNSATARMSLADYFRQHAALNFDLAPNARPNVDELKAAIEQFDKALEIEPEYIDAWLSRGTTWRQMGEVDKALSDYGRAIEIQPQRGDVRFFRATLLRSRGDYEQAVEDYLVAADDARTAASAHQELADTYFRAESVRDLEKAEFHAEKAYEMTKQANLASVKTLSDIRVARGDVKGAIDILREAEQAADAPTAQLLRMRINELDLQQSEQPQDE